VIDIHYGTALKTEHRDEGGEFIVYGSNGPVGKHIDRIVDHPTIIIGRKGSVGAIHYAEFGGWPIDTTYYVQIKNEAKLDLRYLYHFLKQADLERFSIVTAIPGLNRDSVYSVKMPLPSSTKEQQRIAAILDKADAILRKREHILSQSSQLLQSAFVHLVGDTIHDTHVWKHVPLNEHLTFLTSGSRGWAEHYVKHGKRFIRSLDVQMNKISDEDACYVNPPEGAEAERTRVQDGDVLLTITGSKVGRVAFVPDGFGEAYVSQHVAILRLNTTIRPRFLSMFLSLPTAGQLQIKRSQYGQTKPGLSLEQIRGFLIPAVPTEVQDRFCAVWQQHNRMMQKSESAVKQGAALFDSLVQRAFRGEL
jgi:type I restriction enzyme S subunit